jgi:putative transcriptional regulator
VARLSGRVRSSEEQAGAGGRIRRRRTAVGLTQQALADAVEVSRQTVISMETGDYAPSVYLALRVARALDTTVEALWDEE